MKVPLLDLKAQYAAIRDEMLAALIPVLDSQYLVNGPAVAELEAAVAEYCGVKCAIGVSSGTDALLCSLMALDIGHGDEVVTTPFTFFATAGVIARVGAKPVFVDIDPDTFNIDPAGIEAAITDQTRAILPVHLYGQMAEMDPIMAIARARGLAVVEDAAQAIGAEQLGRKAGTIGTTGCFSFYPTKNLGGLGDGGMIVTQDEALAEKIRLFRTHGEKPKYYYHHVGGNFRLDTLQAAGLLVKLPHLDAWSQARGQNGDRYRDQLGDLEEITLPRVREHNVSVTNQYVIRAQRRDELKAHLAERGVGSDVYYPLCLHEQACFADLGHQRGDFPQAEAAAAEVLALPIFPELTDEQIDYVCDEIRAFYAG